jgi:molybdate transport system ATP-binding protein
VSGELAASIGIDRGAFTLDLELRVPAGGTLALLGPNGAGKSTTLRALAGLVRLDAGSIRLSGRMLDDAARVFVPPEQRGVGFVFQDYLLFPHLTALENVAFGLRARGVGQSAARATAATWLDRVGLSARLGSLPSELSGGQAQRVALGRALAVEPRLLLMDEPLAALDAETRPQLRTELAAHLAEFDGCVIIVSHDPIDALVLGDELAVLEHGRLVQAGTPLQVVGAPRTEYVARLMGLNLVPGRRAGERLVFSPADVTVAHHEPAEGSVRWRGRVVAVEQHLSRLRLAIDTADGGTVFADLPAVEFAALRASPGAEVWLSVPESVIGTVGSAVADPA